MKKTLVAATVSMILNPKLGGMLASFHVAYGENQQNVLGNIQSRYRSIPNHPASQNRIHRCHGCSCKNRGDC